MIRRWKEGLLVAFTLGCLVIAATPLTHAPGL